MNQKPIQLRKIRDFGQCISDAFLFLRQHFKPLVGSTLAICGIFLLMEVITAYYQQTRQLRIFLGAIETRPSPLDIFSTGYFIHLALILLVHTLVICSVNAYIAAHIENQNKKPSFADVWGFLTYYFWRVFGGAMLGNVLTVIGLIFCLVPGIWLMPIMVLIVPVIVIENSSVGFAFNRSFNLIKGNWWQSFTVILVAFIIATVPGYFIGAIFGIIGGTSVYFATGKHLSNAFGFAMAMIQAVMHILYIFPTIAIVLCYFSLVEEKENVGMLGRIENFDKQKEQENPDHNDPEEQY